MFNSTNPQCAVIYSTSMSDIVDHDKNTDCGEFLCFDATLIIFG